MSHVDHDPMGESRSETTVERFGPTWHMSMPSMRAMVVALAGVGLLVAWWMSRGGSSSPSPVVIAASGSPMATADRAADPGGIDHVVAAGGPSETRALTTVTVDVVGPVRRPGVVSLPAGSRVVDAIAAAGGLTSGRGGPGLRLNLARPLTDGEQVDATGRTTPEPGGAGAAPEARREPQGRLDLNRATISDLDSLPRVGPVTAQKIIDFRQQHGGFRTVEQLKEIGGIGDRTFEQLAPLVRV